MKGAFIGQRRTCQLEMTKFSRLDVWGRAQIVAYAKTGLARTTIATKVRKPGGGQPTPRAVRAVIQKARKNRTWRGARVHAGGRTPVLAEAGKALPMEVKETAYSKQAHPTVNER